MISDLKREQIVMVTEGGPHIWAIVNAVSDRFGPVTVILETPESKSQLLRRRARRQGWISVAGQVGTMLLTKLGKRLFARRADAIAAEGGLETAPRAGQAIVQVPSANSPEFLQAIEIAAPKVVFLAGCRMLSRQTLAAMPCPVLNYHAGITPKYRGMNGGYWALAKGDAENFGATVHLVDAGVDTGAVLHQVRGSPKPGDNLMLYPLRLAALSREICISAIEETLAGRLDPIETGLPSSQWYHPPIWSYLWTGLRRGIW
ncbi:formyl transferase [Mesorhizobium sp. WSM2239]|uniref:phosphoribosylglycinamide formyltransferase 1 n=2 Tax=unclassified Mesorhizobium TaxID=325217 RepID=A0AAU8DDU3_9HYPH